MQRLDYILMGSAILLLVVSLLCGVAVMILATFHGYNSNLIEYPVEGMFIALVLIAISLFTYGGRNARC